MISDHDQSLFEFLILFEVTNITSSIITNLFLIYLIVYRSSCEIGAYRYLLLAFTINDIYFPIVHFLTLPVICSYKDAFIMFANGIFTSRFSICFFGAAFSQTMPLLAHLFIYRLIATKWPHKLHFYTRRNCFLLITITLGIENPVWFLHCYFNGYDGETGDYVQPFLDDTFDGEGTEFIGALYYSAQGKFRLSAFFTTMGFNAIMAACMSLIIYCSLSIVAHLRNGIVKYSTRTRQLQQHLFHTLVVQTIIPMIFVYFPCAGIINLPLFGFRLSVFPNLVSASLTLFPLIDAFIVMFGVRSYRRPSLENILTSEKKTSSSSHMIMRSVSRKRGYIDSYSLLSSQSSFTSSQMNGSRIIITVSTH